VPERSPVLWAFIPNLAHIAFCYEHPEVKTAPRILNVRKKKENKEHQIKKKKKRKERNQIKKKKKS
jgi:hypothetical protein